eukprot:CAMPEP_0113486152 /NCGR_PEP_ID=MMETSP0014_2-20120614/24849_1 /TAXON_ID=2857 /ORGANISM="Nitzschia sp." /LENGTH=207 /DNA_ID=CAMNT_0000379815 /DNA_START=144 /DNA_END=767 /DNA_ORIENTATION=+ /assembly_acc=CAM_ASM_000159
MSLLLRSINHAQCAVVAVAVVLMVMAATTTTTTDAFQPSTRSSSSSSFSIHRALSPASPSPSASHLILSAMTEEKTKESKVEETTEKYGLEVGLAQAAKDGDGESAKSLLKKYGIAYLATSIPLALVSFGICYVLVDNGVDVGALLSKVGIDNSSAAADKAGTFAIAYAAHKAASPIRFPPTVLLTPLVAKLIGKEPETIVDDGESP